MRLLVVVSVLIGSFVLACSTAAPAPAEPTPNIDATVVAGIQGTQEARVAQERAIDATVEARLNEAKTSQPTSGPSPTDTPMPVPTSAPMLAPTPEPPPTDTPTLVPTASPVPTPTFKPTLSPTPTPFPQDGRYTMFVDPKEGEFAEKTIRFKIGDSYAAETAIWEQGGFTELPLSVESLIDGNASTYREVSGGSGTGPSLPPHLFTGKGYFGGNQIPLGTVVSAWIDGIQVSESTIVAERLSYVLGETSEMFSSLGVNLQIVWHWCHQLIPCGTKYGWNFYVPDFETLGINTYTDIIEADIVWVLVSSNQDFQSGTLVAGWNLIALETSTAATPASSATASFGDGTWVVGSDIQAGTYRSSKTGSGCYWQRLSGFSGEFSDIIVNELTDAISVVEISSTDAGFSTERCGTWTQATSAITSSLSSPFGDGVFVVGLDIGPGTWTSPGGDSCYWARLSGFSGDLNHIEANGLGGANNILTIKSTDKGFESSNCGTWTKIG